MSVVARLQRYFRFIAVALLASSIYFQAGGLRQLLVASWVMLEEPNTSSMQQPGVPRLEASRRMGCASPILSRNVFDSITGPVTFEPSARIERISDTEFIIDCGLLDELLSIRKCPPHYCRPRKGPVSCSRVFGIRPDTLLGTLGIQNGDRLDQINGLPLRTAQQAQDAYAQLRAATELDLLLSRRGRPAMIHYVLR